MDGIGHVEPDSLLELFLANNKIKAIAQLEHLRKLKTLELGSNSIRYCHQVLPGAGSNSIRYCLEAASGTGAGIQQHQVLAGNCIRYCLELGSSAAWKLSCIRYCLELGSTASGTAWKHRRTGYVLVPSLDRECSPVAAT
jgi:hypothetical protein